MITAIVLAAGESKRMGQPKMLMPWGGTTVFGKVIEVLREACVANIIAVTGGLHDKLIELDGQDLRFVQNKDYSNGEMITSVKLGLRNAGKEQEAALIVLGDQPQIQVEIVKGIIARYVETHHSIIVPSYKMHRGHPWLVERSYWQEIVRLEPPATLRDFLNNHAGSIDYIKVDTPSVLQDIDTKDDYLQYKPSQPKA